MKTRSIIAAFSLIVSVSVSLAQVINESMLISCNATSLSRTDGYKKRQFDYAKHQVAKNDKSELCSHEDAIIVNNNLNNSGSWTTLSNGDRIWRISYTVRGAQTLNFLFSEFFMPKGGKLYLYNKDRTDLLGVYDAQYNNEKRKLRTQLNVGSNVLLEYYEPATVKGEGKLNISKILFSDSGPIGGWGQFYRFL